MGIQEVMEITTDSLIREDEKRHYEVFDSFNPITGRGMPGSRQKVRINDFPACKRMWVPTEVMRNHMFRKVVKLGSIKDYIESVGLEATEKEVQRVVFFLCRIRASEDPGFAFALFYKIQDKKSGLMVPFIINYPQLLVLRLAEEQRRAREPIKIVIGKARQWGGSTLAEFYMKWMIDFKHQGWNMVVIAHVKDAAKRVKAMFEKAVKSQVGWSVGADGKRLELMPYQGSQSDFQMKTTSGDLVRTSVISVATYERPDSMRSGDIKMGHYTEVAYWKKTAEKDPEEVISSISASIPDLPDTVEIFESTGRTATGLFYNMYQEGKDPDAASAYKSIFIPFFIIPHDQTPVKDKREFAQWLIDNKNNEECPKGYRESGKFFWWLWEQGASFDAINWYRRTRNKYPSHTRMATEAPVTDVEMFRNSGKLIFDMYAIDALERACKKKPEYEGDIITVEQKGPEAIKGCRFELIKIGEKPLAVWKLPDKLKVANRYVVSVDIGGSGENSDYTVMTVIDRLGMIAGLNGKPRVVARWRGHIRHDLLAWKAAALAHFYDDALLVIESNSADTHNKYSDTEGDHFGTIIQEIADYYPNLYVRQSAEDNVQEKQEGKFGFHTNVLTKGWVIDNYQAYIDDSLYVEPDERCYTELNMYERREDGTIGNTPGKGNHDDIVMSTGIGLYVSQYKMSKPYFIKVTPKASAGAKRATVTVRQKTSMATI